MMYINALQKWSIAFFALITILWVVLFLNHVTEGFYNYFYSFLFGLVPLIAGIIAMGRAHIWGNFRSAVGKAVFFIGLGIFCWGAGEAIWSYYNFILHVAAPYPSLADI